MQQAAGTFEVKMTPDAPDAVDRHTIDKTFAGDLEGTSRGRMLSARSADGQSGVYVAMERVEGRLAGKSGSFILHHTGIMDGGTQSLDIRVVASSGTGELAGIRGAMRIHNDAGRHTYELEYTLDESA